MSKAFKPFAWVLGLALCANSASAFSLLGPTEAYQVEQLGYLYGFRNGTKNLDDEYRCNTRVVYYSFDPEFTSYFGSNGIAAVDGAFGVLNNLRDVSDYSSDLTEFPLDAKSVNYSAAALNLYDLKSATLELLVERLGLADPELFVWTLRARALPGGAQCPLYEYLVIKRNFDPLTEEPSSYINGNLFTYYILELCPSPDRAYAIPLLVDPLAQYGNPVASFGTALGEYWRGLTRDDMGGLRYLLSTNNLNWETTPDNSFVFATNTSQPILLYPSNLEVFAEQALTNNAADLVGLYPGLQVTATSNFFVNVVTTNVSAYFTNYYTDPVGTPPRLVLRTNYSTNVATYYEHTFGNVVVRTNAHFTQLFSLQTALANGWNGGDISTRCVWSLLTTNIGPSPYLPAGSGVSVTNVTIETFVSTNCLSGSFFILPTNVCDLQLLHTQLTQVLTFTNFLTNTFTSTRTTNAASTNVSDYYEYSQSIITYFTNRILVVYPVVCPDDITSLFQGIEKVNFVRRDYDSLLGQFFEPVTNDFTLTEVTNNRRVTRYIRRTLNGPDILFTADDLVTGPTTYPIINPVHSATVPNFQTPGPNNLGPGTIASPTTFSFNKVGPSFYNIGPAFIDEATAFPEFVWGSFDGSTNAPIVYPVGTDLASLENMAVLQITQPTVVTNGAFRLPDGDQGVLYNGGGFQLEAVGGQPPYVWSFAPGSAGLPEGLTLDSSGLISGTPIEAGTFDFTIRLTESGARHIDGPFTLIINP